MLTAAYLYTLPTSAEYLYTLLTTHCCVSLHAAPCCAALHAAHELPQVAAAERRLLAVLPMLSAVECSMGSPMQASATTTGEDLLMHEAQSGAR